MKELFLRCVTFLLGNNGQDDREGGAAVQSATNMYIGFMIFEDPVGDG